MVGGACFQCNDLGIACVPVSDAVKTATSKDFRDNAEIRSYHNTVRIAANEAVVTQIRYHVQEALPSIFARIRALEEVVRVQGMTIITLQQQVKKPPMQQTLGYTPMHQNDRELNVDL
jgi:hypothetical protein